MTAKNVADSIIRNNIINGDYQPVNIDVKYSGVDFVAPLDKRSSACNLVRSSGENTNKPKYIIIHGTTPGISSNARLSGFEPYLISLSVNQGTTWKWRSSIETKPAEDEGGSGHYTVFKGGQVVQHINEADPVKQCAGYNFNSIGIEHHFIFGREPPTEQMYRSSAKLVKNLIERYQMYDGGKELRDIVFPHDPTYDPGPYWDWEYFYSLVEGKEPKNPARQKEQTEANLGTDWSPTPYPPSANMGPRKKIRPSHALPFYKNEKDVKNLSTEEIENGILPFFIDDIVKNAPVGFPFIRFNTDKHTPFLTNLMFGKEIKDYKKYGSLTNIELSNFVPFVEFSLIKEAGEYLYPFDDYTSRAKIENIFSDKTSRGGAVGIKSISWKSLATNQSNLAQQTVKISLLIQDIQEIDAIRNGVSLLDFLYPAGSRDPVQYSRNNFNVKMKVGWKYKNNSLTSTVGDKISKDMLEETMYLSLFKHSFEFNEKDGTVLLNIEYIGMLEAELADNIESNTIQELQFKPNEKEVQEWQNTLTSFNNWDKKSELVKTPNVKHSATVKRPELRDATSGGTISEKASAVFQVAKDVFVKNEQIVYDLDGKKWTGDPNQGLSADDIEEIKETIKEKIKESERQASRKQEIGYVGLINDIFVQGGMNHIYLSEEDISFIKSLSASETSLSPDQIKKADEIKKASVKNLISDPQANANMAILEENLRAYQVDLSGTAWLGTKEKTEMKDILNIMRAAATSKKPEDVSESKEEVIFIPYTFLGVILNTFYKRVFEEVNKVSDANKLRFALGQFSYSLLPEDIANRPQNEQGGGTIKPDQIITNEDGVKILQVSPIKKYTNILNIPISLQSFDNWYRSNIIDAEIKNMSFYDFTRKILFELVPQNLNPKIIPWAPEIDFTPSLYFETIVKNEEDENFLRIQQHNEIDSSYFFDSNLIKNNPFYNFYKRREDKTKKQIKLNEKINYLFILSKNETSSALTGDPGQDASRNIIHLYIGEETGLVKRIKFSREDNKQLDAANIVLANKTQGKPGIIRQIYQLNLEMFGNTIFYPGTLLHITPTYPGSRLPNSTLYKIGLGGYYFVTEVSSRIEDNQFTTSIGGKWQATGRDGPESLNSRRIAIEIPEKTVEEKQMETNPQQFKTTLLVP